MTSQVVRKLEAKGLLAREVDAADTRARRLRPSPEGVSLAQRAIAAVEDADERFFDVESDELVAVLQRLVTIRPPRRGRGT
jgi:DNA-binding MarR family transcriptional regulator